MEWFVQWLGPRKTRRRLEPQIRSAEASIFAWSCSFHFSLSLQAESLSSFCALAFRGPHISRSEIASGFLQSAFGLDRNFRIFARGRASHNANLFIAVLVARDLNVLRIDLLRKPRH